MNQFLISSHEGLLDYETTRWKGQFSLEIFMRYFIIYPLRSTTTKVLTRFSNYRAKSLIERDASILHI